jgi:hypothetical protein
LPHRREAVDEWKKRGICNQPLPFVEVLFRQLVPHQFDLDVREFLSGQFAPLEERGVCLVEPMDQDGLLVNGPGLEAAPEDNPTR